MKTKFLFQPVRILLVLMLSLLMAGCSRPRITADQIDTQIMHHGVRVRRGEIYNWFFDEGEPRTFHIVQSDYTRKTAAIVIFMETENVHEGHQMKGQIRLHYLWVDDQWSLKKLENIDFLPVADQGPYHKAPPPTISNVILRPGIFHG